MLFNSSEYLLFLPLVFLLYWVVLGKNIKGQNLLIVFASYLFYGWWDYRFLALIALSTVGDYLLGNAIYNSEDEAKRKRLLFISLFLNLGFLALFKYYNFFVSSLEELLQLLNVPINTWTLKIILPVGISFYTFQTLSYTIDIYRKELKPSKEIINFFAFVSFFPQLVAGPIERAVNLLPQFEQKRFFSYQQCRDGLQLILWGLFTKVVIADRVAEYVDTVFNNLDRYHGLSLLVAAFLFSIQIYGDFSGYSNIARGSAKLLGFELMVNFRAPYFATTIREFWASWHISLSTWFRDYVYIPLGGNRGSHLKWVKNVMATFLLSGLWHGANWTFIIWGAIHGLINIVESLPKRFNIPFKLPKLIRGLIVFGIVVLAWIFFRAQSVGQAFEYLQKIPNGLIGDLSSFENIEYTLRSFISDKKELMTFVVSFFLFALVEIYIGKRDINVQINKIPTPIRWAAYFLLTGWILYFGAFNKTVQFIYFQF